MTGPVPPARVTATPAARQAIVRLRAARGGPLMFVQSGGCCAGSTPMCYPAGEFITGDADVLLGDIDGCPFYIDRRLDHAWHQDQFVLDVGRRRTGGLLAGRRRRPALHHPVPRLRDGGQVTAKPTVRANRMHTIKAIVVATVPPLPS